MFSRTRPSVTFLRTLPVLFSPAPSCRSLSFYGLLVGRRVNCQVLMFRRNFFRLQRRKVSRDIKVRCILKMEAACSFEPLVHVYRTVRRHILYSNTGVLISPKPEQEGNKLQRQKTLSFICPIYNHNWRTISTIYIYNKTSIKRNILTIKQNTSGSKSG